MVLFAGLALVAARATPGEPGRYRVRAADEVASELVLEANGRFRWTFVDDRVDQRAGGRWRRSGSAVLLTTDPPAGAFELVRESAYLSGEWTLQIEVQHDGVPISGAALQVGFATGAVVRGTTAADGWCLSRRERRRPMWLRVELPAYGIRTSRLPIFAREANAIRFQLQRVAAGTVNFRHERVQIRGDTLVLRRGDSELVYERVAAGQ